MFQIHERGNWSNPDQLAATLSELREQYCPMAESLAALTPSHPQSGRHYERTHMFVAATLVSGAGSCQVHIRNMSKDGALIEGAILAPADSPVTLRRGSLQTPATIVWRTERRAGMAFCGPVTVADWMSRNPPAHQSTVDEIVRAIRAGKPEAPARAVEDSAASGSSLEAELRALKGELGRLEAGLCASIRTVTDHPEIQLLDIARQRIERLLAGLHEGN
jgi:hypothetical protein